MFNQNAQERSWFHSNDTVSISSMPRKLHVKEINYILFYFAQHAKIGGFTRDSRQMALRCIIRKIRIELLQSWLPLGTLSDTAVISVLERLARVLVNKHHQSQASTGYYSGIISSTSISQLATQATLNTFKSLGSSSMVEAGIEAYTRLLHARKPKPSTDKMIIHLNVDISPDDIRTLRRILVEVNITGIIIPDSWEAGKLAPIEGEISESYTDDYIPYLTRYWWHTTYELLSNDNRLLPNYAVLRMRLDPQLCVVHRISPYMVRKVILERYNKADMIHVVCSDVEQGIVDIIAIPEKTSPGVASYSKQMTFLKNLFDVDLPNIFVKGIKGITRVFRKTLNLSNLVSDTKPVIIITLQFKSDVISTIYELCEGIVDIAIDGFIVYLASSMFTGHDQDLNIIDDIRSELITYSFMTGWITSIVRNNRDALDAIFPPMHKVKSFFRDNNYHIIKVRDIVTNLVTKYIILGNNNPVELLSKSSKNKYTYISTSGKNLEEILKIPWVDPKRTTSNDLFEINDYLGCEASWNYAVSEFKLVLMDIDGSDVDPRHTTLALDTIYIKGYPIPLTPIGDSARGQDFMARVTNQRAPDALRDAATSGQTSSMLNTASSAIWGGKPVVGKYAQFLFNPNEKLVEEFRQEIQKKYELRRQTVIHSPQGRKNAIMNNCKRMQLINSDIVTSKHSRVPVSMSSYTVTKQIDQAPTRKGDKTKLDLVIDTWVIDNPVNVPFDKPVVLDQLNQLVSEANEEVSLSHRLGQPRVLGLPHIDEYLPLIVKLTTPVKYDASGLIRAMCSNGEAIYNSLLYTHKSRLPVINVISNRNEIIRPIITPEMKLHIPISEPTVGRLIRICRRLKSI